MDRAPPPPQAPPPAPQTGALRRIARLCRASAASGLVVAVWCPVLVALHHLTDRGWAAPALVGLGAAALWWWAERARWPLLAGALALASLVGWVATRTPRNDRDWTPDTARLPRISIEGDTMTVANLRNFAWRSLDSFDEAWETRVYDLSALTGMELIVEPFGDSGLFAHTMLDFGFAGGDRLLVSIEARKERGEAYGLIPGALGAFELTYVFMDERDGLTLRAVHRGHPVHAYPVRAEPAQFRTLLEDLAGAADDLNDSPRFYRVVLCNCTTAWVRHVDRQRLRPIGLRYETLLPARTGRLLHDQGMMATDLPFEEADRMFRIDGRVREFAADPGFSRKIREGAEPEARAAP